MPTYKSYKTYTIAFALLMFLLFRPFQMQKNGMFFSGDDVSYFAYSTSFAYFTYPDLSKEYTDEFNVAPLARVGPGLMAAPFVFAFSLLDRATGHPIVQARNAETIGSSWSAFGYMVSTVFYFWLAGVLLLSALSRYFSEATSLKAVILMLLTQGLGIYAFRRPIFSHVPELLIQSMFLWIFVHQLKSPVHKKIAQKKLLIATVALSSMAMLVRQNSIIYALVWPVLILTEGSIKNAKQAVTAAATFVAAYLVFKVTKTLPFWINPAPYEASNKLFETTSFLTDFQPLYFYLKRTWTVLFGADWGLLYTAPFILLGICGFKRGKFQHKAIHLLAALPLLVNFYILLIWKGQGSYYGYRYLLFSAAPVLLIPFAAWIEWLKTKTRYANLILAFISIFPTLSMLFFEATPDTLMVGVTTEFGEKNVGNLTYQIGVWKTVFTQPFYAVYAVLKNGPAYLIYLASHLLGFFDKLPEKFRMIYDSFQWLTLVRTVILYALPWIFLKGICTSCKTKQ